ncbi:hypothetical protein OHU34_00765 [Streptomyces sp. NBC_00080]
MRMECGSGRDTDIKHVLETMEEHQIRRLPIVGEDKQLVPDKEVGRFVEAVVARSV